MKKLLLLFVLLLALPMALADMNVSINAINLDGDIDIYANPNSGNGTTTYFLDGVDFKEVEQRVINVEGRKSRKEVNGIAKSFFSWRWGEIREVAFEDVNGDDYQRLRWVLETFFVPRKELQSVIMNQQRQINEIQVQLLVFENLFTEKQICESRTKIGLELEIPKIQCYGKIWKIDKHKQTYYNIESVKQNTVKQNSTEV